MDGDSHCHDDVSAQFLPIALLSFPSRPRKPVPTGAYGFDMANFGSIDHRSFFSFKSPLSILFGAPTYIIIIISPSSRSLLY